MAVFHLTTVLIKEILMFGLLFINEVPMKKISTLIFALIFAFAVMPFVNAQTSAKDTKASSSQTVTKKDKKAAKKKDAKADAAKK
jgi:hypothetical protein